MAEQIAQLHDLVEEFVLGRVWARQKEETFSNNAANDAETPALPASIVSALPKPEGPDASNRESNSEGPCASDLESDSERSNVESDEGLDDYMPESDDGVKLELHKSSTSAVKTSVDAPIIDSLALVIQSSSLQSLDEALPIHEPVIPSTVIARSTKAIDFLLDKWSIPPMDGNSKAIVLTKKDDMATNLGHETLTMSTLRCYPRVLQDGRSYLSRVPPDPWLIHDKIQPSKYVIRQVLAQNKGFIPSMYDEVLESGEELTASTLGSFYLYKARARQNKR